MLQRSLPQVNQLGSLLVQSILQRPAGAAMQQALKATVSLCVPNASTFSTSGWASVRRAQAATYPARCTLSEQAPGDTTSAPLC